MFLLFLITGVVVVGLIGVILMCVNEPYRGEGANRHANPIGITLDVIGLVMLIGAMIVANGLITDIDGHLAFRRLMHQNDAPYGVMPPLANVRQSGRIVSWDVPEVTALWTAVNVYTEEDTAPATRTLSGDVLTFSIPETTKWTSVKIWYGTPHGASVPVTITNSEHVKAPNTTTTTAPSSDPPTGSSLPD